MELEEAEFDFSYDDGEKFSYIIGNKKVNGLLWLPDKEKDKNCTVIHVYGLGDWLSRNKDVYKVLTNNGFSVLGTDHIGHGISEGKPCSTSVDEIVEEIIQNILFSKKRLPYNKVFLWGHSLGGLSVLQAALNRPEIIKSKVSGIICESPWLSSTDKSNPITLFQSVFLYLGYYFFPEFQIKLDIAESKDEMPEKFIQMNKGYKYNYNIITPKMMYSVLYSITDVRSMYQMWPKDLKLMIAYGKKDETVNMRDVLPYINDLMINTSRKDVSVVSYDGYHALTKCKARKEFLTDVIEFIDETLDEIKRAGRDK